MAEETLSHEESELDPTLEPKASKPWLAMLEDYEDAFDDYNHRADNIDKLFADLEKLANNTRDREFQLLWSTMQVIGPSIYARAPVPVVVPKFKDRDLVKGTASELLERCSVVNFDLNDIDGVMKLVRDDLALQNRGVIRLLYEDKDGEPDYEKACIMHVDRKDYRHEPARNDSEVGWKAFAAYKTRGEMRKRFKKYSGDAYKDVEYKILKDDRERGAADSIKKCKVWEIWSKTHNKVVWVAEGSDVVLDENPPHLKLEGFYPCPRPAYGTLQRGSLVPVPDVLQYKDQLEEINQLTGRIHALSDALKVRGFYPAGAGEIGDAIETALKTNDNRQVMVPISNWAAFGSGSAKDTIVWLPIEVIAATITQLVELRRQVIEDVYQIVGISDIMRGQADNGPKKTATEQNLKAQFGSVRIRDRQAELVRIARDTVRIAAEIMAENFSKKTLLAMSQMDIPSEAQIKQQIGQLTAQAEAEVKAKLQEAASNPELMQKAQENPQQAKQMADQMQAEIVGKVQPQIEKLKAKPTQEQVFGLLKDQKIRPFTLDIETDSTIQPDEDAEKQRRTEFLGMLGTVMKQVGEMVMAQPATAPFAGEIIKFAVAPFRAGRTMDQAIDDFVDAMTQQMSKPQPNPEAEAAKAEAQAEQQRTQADMAMKDKELQGKLQIEQMKMQGDQEARAQDAQIKQQEAGMKMQQIEAESRRDEQRFNMEMQLKNMEMQFKQQELGLKMQAAEVDNQMKMQTAQINAQSAQQQAQIKTEAAEQQMQHNEQSFQQQSALNQQKAQQGAPNG